MVPVIDLRTGNLEMTNLRTDEMVFSRNLTKIGTDENKAIYSTRHKKKRYANTKLEEYGIGVSFGTIEPRSSIEIASEDNANAKLWILWRHV